MGWVPGRMVKPLAAICSRKKRVFCSRRSRRSVDEPINSSALSDAATIGGGRELENRYGRERWRSRSMISRRPEV